MPKEIAVIQTSRGIIEVLLNREKAPKTVENFVRYAKEGGYNGTIFHRVIAGFMIQGGGYTPDGHVVPTHEPIALESANGLKNEEGTIAMARTSDPDSATNQFFINTMDNAFLNRSAGNPGYAVFGKVVKGMEAVKAIEGVQTGIAHGMEDWPKEDVLIKSVSIKNV